MRELTLRLGTGTVDELDDIDWHAVRSSPAARKMAFTHLYRRYVTRVFRYCISRVGSSADAEDITAQVFTEVYEGLDRYRHRGSFAGWLFTIVRRRVIDHYRARDITISLNAAWESALLTTAPESSDPSRKAIRAEDLAKLARLVEGLRDKDQELLRLRFAADLTYAEIARVLGRSEGAVKMALHRLLRRLKQRWEVT